MITEIFFQIPLKVAICNPLNFILFFFLSLVNFLIFSLKKRKSRKKNIFTFLLSWKQFSTKVSFSFHVVKLLLTTTISMYWNINKKQVGFFLRIHWVAKNILNCYNKALKGRSMRHHKGTCVFNQFNNALWSTEGETCSKHKILKNKLKTYFRNACNVLTSFVAFPVNNI